MRLRSCDEETSSSSRPHCAAERQSHPKWHTCGKNEEKGEERRQKPFPIGRREGKKKKKKKGKGKGKGKG